MAEVRSIFSYVDKKCYNGLYDAAAEYIAEHGSTRLCTLSTRSRLNLHRAISKHLM